MKRRISSWVMSLFSLGILVTYLGVAMPKQPNAYSIRFNYFTVLTVIGVSINIVLLLIVLTVRSRHSATKWYSLFSATLITGLLMNMMNALANTPEVGFFWERMAYAAWIPAAISFFLFCMAYTNDEDESENQPLFIILIIFMCLSGYLVGRSNEIGFWGILEYQHSAVGYEVVKLTADYSILSQLMLLVAFIAGSFVMFLYSRKQRNVLAKKQLRLFNLAFAQLLLMLPIDLAYNFGIIRTVFGNDIPALTPFYLSNMGILVGYGVLKYGIFRINPNALSGTILENLSEAVVATDDKYNIQFMNQSVEDITGFRQELLKGEHLSILFNTDRFSLISQGIANSAKTFVLEETEIKNHQGQPVPIAMSVGKVGNSDKQQSGYVFVFANISELKKKTIELAREKASVEQKVVDRTKELSEEHARLTASINSLKVGFLMTNIQGELMIINPSASVLLELLCDAQELAKPSAWNLSAVDAILRAGVDISPSIQESRASVKSFEFKEVQLAKHFVHIFIAPVEEHGSVIGNVILIEDITDERALNRSKDEFFVIASHELRTPLTKLRGSAELMRDVYRSSITSEKALEMLDEIEKSSGHLIQIVNNFIEMTELELGKIHVKHNEFNLVESMQSIISAAKNRYPHKSIQARVIPSEGEIMIVSDQRRLEQVLTSLVDNAFKFTKEGEVELSAEAKDHSVLITIRDTGMGIKQENQSLLFRKFQQAGSSLLSRDGEGTGLGLYLVKLLVEALGGTVELKGSEIGMGSTFTVRIPVTSDLGNVAMNKHIGGKSDG